MSQQATPVKQRPVWTHMQSKKVRGASNCQFAIYVIRLDEQDHIESDTIEIFQPDRIAELPDKRLAAVEEGVILLILCHNIEIKVGPVVSGA